MNMKKLLIILGVVIVAIILFVVFKKDKTMDEGSFAIGEASVDSVEISFQESFPLGVNVSVTGNLPDSCTELGDVIQMRDETTGEFIVTLETKRPLDAMCAQALSAFDTSFILEGTTGLPKGEYTVVVNGVRENFVFQVDNFVSEIDALK